jgi:hypothetical protein
MARDARKGFRIEWRLSLLVVFLFAAWKGGRYAYERSRSGRDDETIRGIVASEELILELTPRLGLLSRSALNLALPDEGAREIFAERVAVVDLAAEEPRLGRELAASSARVRTWRPGEREERAAQDLALWRPFLERVHYFEHARFYLKDGRFSGSGFRVFDSDAGFEGLARTKDGAWSGARGKLRVVWERAPEAPVGGGGAGPAPAAAAGGGALWRIAALETRSLETTDSGELLFAEVLDRALPRAADLEKARRSLHEEAAVRYYEGGAQVLPSPYFAPISANQKPAVSVADVDGDGLDDLYVMERLGKNQLLRNRGDGTFEEVAAEWGLDLDGDSTAAIFADFDNDGDPDVFLGRSLKRSLYLENDGRRFIDRSFAAPALPYLVVSMAAADYNGDGLLDLYLCTYRPAILEDIVTGAQTTPYTTLGDDQSPVSGVAKGASRWPDEFLSPEEAREHYRRHGEASPEERSFGNVLDQVGPPNVLLVNRGGRFETAPESAEVGVWRNSLQATWGDHDEDGDPDLYVANDWARDYLFRNDGPAGFADVTEEAGITHFGFAMGATWGDYDNDGHDDLYVSNMYSKAGRRITARIPGLDSSFAASAAGNYLYRQDAGRFELVSGLEPPGLLVADAGWSWGGQFADLDNDGYLDLYVLSGYYTAPEKLSTGLDL